MNLIYCYDAYCGWCYAFSPVVKQIAASYAGQLYTEVLSGGMILPDVPKPISATAGFIQQAYKNVEAHTGVKFGQDYLWHIFHPEQSDWFPNSEKPAIALSIIKELKPEKAVSFAAALQYALHFEGRDLTDDEAYRHLLPEYAIDADDFYRYLHEDSFKEKAYYDFALVKQLGINSFPVLLIQENESRFHLVSKGYADLDTVSARIDKILHELRTKHSH